MQGAGEGRIDLDEEPLQVDHAEQIQRQAEELVALTHGLLGAALHADIAQRHHPALGTGEADEGACIIVQGHPPQLELTSISCGRLPDLQVQRQQLLHLQPERVLLGRHQRSGSRIDEGQHALLIDGEEPLGQAVGDGGREFQLRLEALLGRHQLVEQAAVLQEGNGHLGELLHDRQVIDIELAVHLVRQL
ncbi:hypothetical protein D9M68_734600 [compost metagenome]